MAKQVVKRFFKGKYNIKYIKTFYSDDACTAYQCTLQYSRPNLYRKNGRKFVT